MDDRPDPSGREEAPTTAMGAGPGADGRFPVRDWGSYELQAYLGSGAMGSVYQAWDRQLQRPVALKFLLGDNPALVERFENEARAQARVEHDNLCKIYEVGETQGRHYIAMQLIDGERLNAAARRMTLAEKVLAVRDVARALHEAHRAGLIHRDVKPSNIMVARTEDGRWKPFVLDFGLARDAQSAGLTMTGAVLGTPAYMAPEQARGEIHKLDRRSDVYALGATLYDMLTDRPPFPGDSFHQILPQVLDDVPRPPRETHPEVPADVESIALKCLRKDPGERYDSARALADDLQRWLDGEAVEARPTSTWYRLRMKARKNRTAVRVGAVALPLVLAAVGWGAWNHWTSARQQELAQEFGQRVQRMESIARIAAMAPLHDIRPEREMIRRQMAEIEGSVRQVGRIARGPGEYALGRGHLALGDVDQARQHLDAAWAEGYRAPEVSYALGLVLGREYQDRLQDIVTITSEEEREEERAAAQEELRDPALEQLRAAAAVETESPRYLEALMALYDDRHDEALAKAREAYAERPWLHEANRLEGEILQLTADALRNGGEYDAASERYAEAERAISRAADVARSDPATYTQLALVALSRIALEVNHRGLDVTPHYEAGVRATNLATAANPEDADAWAARAQIHKRMAEYRISQGQDAGTHLDDAIAAGERAAALNPESASAHWILGGTYRQVGKELRRRGEDPRPAFEKAIDAYKTAGTLKADWALHAGLGLLHKDVALYRSSVGEDPTRAFEEAISAYHHAIVLRPTEFSSHYNLGAALIFLATHKSEHGLDPRPHLTESIEAFASALDLAPEHGLVLQSLGRSYNTLAEYELGRGLNPQPSIASALAALTKAIDSNPQSAYLAYLYDGRGIAYTCLARYQFSRGMDAASAIESARLDLERAIAVNPDYSYSYANLAYVYATLAESQVTLGTDPRHAVSLAIENGKAALAIDPKEPFTYSAIAAALCAQALHRLETGNDPSPAASEAIRYITSIQAVNPTDADLNCRLGTALALTVSSRSAAAAASLHAFDVALTTCSTRAEIHAAKAEACLRLASWRLQRRESPAALVSAGVAAANAALEINPSLAGALAIKGALLVAASSSESSTELRNDHLARARGCLTEARTLNPNLTHRVQEILQQIARLDPGTTGA